MAHSGQKSDVVNNGNSMAVSQSNVVELLSFFLERSPALVSFKTLDGRYVFANTEMEDAYGVIKGGLVGRSNHEFMAYVDAAELAAKDRAVASSGRAVRSLDRLNLTGRGELSLATVRFPQMNEKGETVGIGLVAIDVTASHWDADHALTDLEHAQQRIAELRQAVDELKVQSATDGLTGAVNRSRMEEILQSEVERFGRYGHQVSLIYFDIDHFKQINDTMGHAAGDDTLRQVSRIVKETIRGSDLFSRWGGEEFLLLLPGTDLTSARLLAEKIRAALFQRDRADFVLVSASFGVAEIQEGETWESWVGRADAAMYLAKRNGRDRVEVDFGNNGQSLSAVRASMNFVHLIWHASYECGQPLIDQQHRALFESANSLISAMVDNWPISEIREVLALLLDEAVEHFSTEEALLREAGYVDAEAHRQIHNLLMARAQEVKERFLSGEDVIGEAFHFLVYEVIAQHMLTEDRKFFPLFAANRQ